MRSVRNPHAVSRAQRALVRSLIFFCACLSVCSGVFGAGASSPEAEKITEHVYRIGRAVLDMKARAVTCEGKVNMRKGVIEYLAVTPEGKRHESVLVLDVEPVHLQVALLLLGLEPGGGLRYQGDSRPPRGSPVEVRARWTSGGRSREVRLEELAWDIPRRRPMEPTVWIFTGMPPGGPEVSEGSLIASYRDPKAILNNPLPTGDDDTVYKANERLVPPVGTPVTVTIRDARPAASDGALRKEPRAASAAQGAQRP